MAVSRWSAAIALAGVLAAVSRAEPPARPAPRRMPDAPPPAPGSFPEFYLKRFPARPAPGAQVYILSGAPDPKARIVADDDLTVRLNDQVILADNDGWASPDPRGGKWRGMPVLFHARPTDRLTVTLYDLVPETWALGPLYLHRAGRMARLLPHVQGHSPPDLDNELFTLFPPDEETPRAKVFEQSWVIRKLVFSGPPDL